MTSIRLRHVDRFRDRHGKWRYYFRLRRGARFPLRGDPGTPEFMESYQRAQRGEAAANFQPKRRGEPGTFDRLAQDYFASADYLRLADSTRRTYRLVIERLIREESIGHRLVREMTREHVRRIISRRSATPGMANSVLRKSRSFCALPLKMAGAGTIRPCG